MGIEGGVENLKWAFSGTFIAMLVALPLFGWAAARFPRRRLLPIVYLFFIANVLSFYALMQSRVAPAATALAFFVWLSVFNLFVISVFWSFMADLFDAEQGKRLFGFIAAGGSLGAVAGPALATLIATLLGPAHLLLLAAALLAFALACVHRLSTWSEANGNRTAAAALGGSVWAGAIALTRSRYLLGICGFIVLYTMLSTFLYFEQARIVADAYDDPAKRTALFAWIDLVVNGLTLTIQVFLTGRIATRFGLPITLALIPALTALGFAMLGLAPTLAVLIAFQIARRAGDYAITRPAREMLFTVVSREDKYKSKNAIDTLVYRGGDALSGWFFSAISAAGASLSAIALIAVPISGVWLATGYLLGRAQERRVIQDHS